MPCARRPTVPAALPAMTTRHCRRRSSRPHALLVWRRGLDTQWRSLSPPEAALLQALAGGANFGALGEQAIGWVDDADQAVPLVVGALQQWLADGLVSGWRVAA